jgi:hypothetical protein
VRPAKARDGTTVAGALHAHQSASNLPVSIRCGESHFKPHRYEGVARGLNFLPLFGLIRFEQA